MPDPDYNYVGPAQMSPLIMHIRAARIAALLFLPVILGTNITACASESKEETEFVFGLGERIIEESCRSDNIYSQCVGQSGTSCENSMRLGLDQCAKQFIDFVPDLDVDPKSLGSGSDTPYHKLGEKLGRCLIERHLDSIGIDKEMANNCFDRIP